VQQETTIALKNLLCTNGEWCFKQCCNSNL